MLTISITWPAQKHFLVPWREATRWPCQHLRMPRRRLDPQDEDVMRCDALVLATAIHLRADRVLTTDAGWPGAEVSVELIRPRP